MYFFQPSVSHRNFVSSPVASPRRAVREVGFLLSPLDRMSPPGALEKSSLVRSGLCLAIFFCKQFSAEASEASVIGGDLRTKLRVT